MIPPLDIELYRDSGAHGHHSTYCGLSAFTELDNRVGVGKAALSLLLSTFVYATLWGVDPD
jgi:hypothetical protein